MTLVTVLALLSASILVSAGAGWGTVALVGWVECRCVDTARRDRPQPRTTSPAGRRAHKRGCRGGVSCTVSAAYDR